MRIRSLHSMRGQITVTSAIAFVIVAICGIALYLNLGKMFTNQKWVAHTIEVTGELRSLGNALVDMETGVRGYAVGGSKAFLEPYHSGFENFSEHFEVVYKLVSDNPRQIQRLDELKSTKDHWINGNVAKIMRERDQFDSQQIDRKTFEASFNQADGKAAMDSMRKLLKSAVDEERALLEKRGTDYEKTVAASKFWATWGLGFSIAFAAAAFTFIINRNDKELNRIADAINSGANQISEAATQVGESSQSLAQGSSEQASSLEETNAAMTELEGMAKQTTENTQIAKQRSANAKSKTQLGESSVTEMAKAMDEIQVSANEVARIVSTIEDIAFQTNILALNAAVEAARAGEAGAGFAVVADEVRSLAHRSAEAAKQTAQQIEKSLVRTERGVSISTSLKANLAEILDSFDEVDSIINQIAQASEDQRNTASQINASLVQIDQVSQEAASQSEENASASEELNAQANALHDQIASLLILAGRTNESGSVLRPSNHPRKSSARDLRFSQSRRRNSPQLSLTNNDTFLN